MPLGPSAEAAEARGRRLAEFLGALGTTPQSIVAEVEGSLGEPLLVVATGSVLQGFGNSRSDVDLDVVVPHANLSMLPIVSFEHGVLVDTTYFGDTEVRRWIGAIRDEPWPPRELSRQAWRRRATEVLNCTRFASGLELVAREGWTGWVEELRQPWLAERVAHWWRCEAIRWLVGGRWLARAKPLLAAQRHCEAVLAALESRAAAAGQLYFGEKWLPEKLRLIGDEQGQEALRTALRTPATDREAGPYTTRCQALVRELLGSSDGDPGLVAQLWYAPGVTVHELPSSTLVSRWAMRGLELGSAPPSTAERSAPIWEGGLDDEPDSSTLLLFVDDMTWLSVAGTP